MNIDISTRITKVVNLADATEDNQSYLFDAVTNLSKFGEYSSMDGNFVFHVTADSAEEAEEKLHDLLSSFNMLCEVKVFKHDFQTIESSEQPTGIDFVHIDFIKHCNYKNAWSDKGRSDALNDTAFNELSSITGLNMALYTNQEGMEMVLFYNDRSAIEELGYDSFEDALEVFPEVTSTSLPDDVKAVLDDIGHTFYGNITTMPKEIADIYFDLSDLD